MLHVYPSHVSNCENMEPESIPRGIGEQLYHEGVRIDFRGCRVSKSNQKFLEVVRVRKVKFIFDSWEQIKEYSDDVSEETIDMDYEEWKEETIKFCDGYWEDVR